MDSPFDVPSIARFNLIARWCPTPGASPDPFNDHHLTSRASTYRHGARSAWSDWPERFGPGESEGKRHCHDCGNGTC